jgi:anti-sigma factor RsiW
MTTPFENDDPWANRLSEYLDGVLGESETHAVDGHLQSCERCRDSLLELRAVLYHLRADPMDQLPETAWPRIAARLTTSALGDTRGARGRVRGSSRGIPRGMVRRITAAAALTLTLVGGIWAGASLCLAGTAWTPPGWMHIGSRGPRTIPRRAQPTVPSYAGDSLIDEWAPLRRSVSDLDQQIADGTRALEGEPQNKTLERVLQQLIRERSNLQTLLDSAAPNARSSVLQR